MTNAGESISSITMYNIVKLFSDQMNRNHFDPISARCISHVIIIQSLYFQISKSFEIHTFYLKAFCFSLSPSGQFQSFWEELADADVESTSRVLLLSQMFHQRYSV